MQTSADNREPSGAAQPIGYRLSGKYTLARYVPGIRTSRMDAILWIKEIPDFCSPQK